MNRSWTLLVVCLTGCASQMIAAESPLEQYSKVVVAVNPNRKANVLDSLNSIYPYVNVVPSLSQRMQLALCEAFSLNRVKLLSEAKTESLSVSKEVQKLRFEPAYQDTLKATEDIQISKEARLDRKAARRIARKTRADVLLVGRVFFYSEDWREFARHTRIGQSISTYYLRFGAAMEYCLFDLKDGRLIDHWSDRQAYKHEAKRRHPPDPAAIGATDDPIVGRRIVNLLDQLANRASNRHLPEID
jgi:hypothetical protein